MQAREHIWQSEDWSGYDGTMTDTIMESNPGLCHPRVVGEIWSLLLNIPPSLLIPYGRAYVAVRYGVALYLDQSSLPRLPPTVGDALSLVVKTCKLPPVPAHISLDLPPGEHDNGECGISLYARLVGSEVVMGQADAVMVRSGTSNHSTCEWHVNFPAIQAAGRYSLELLEMWLNEVDEPDPATRNRNKEERVNDGNIVNLSGCGTHSFYVLNATMKYYPTLFQGQVVRPVTGKTLYLISNNTFHTFDNWGAYVGLGYENGDVVQVSDAFFSQHFKPGADISSAAENEQFRKGVAPRSPTPANVAVEVVQVMSRIHILSFESRARLEGMVFGLPAWGLNFSHSAASSALFCPPARACARGDELGRWVYEPVCEFNVTVSLLESSPGRGHECRHTISPVMDHWDFDFKTRLRRHVWRPYNCSLLQLREDAFVDPTLSYCDNLAAFLASSRAQQAGRSSGTVLPFMSESGAGGKRQLLQVHSLSGYALRSQGIGAIAGFGDSLGEEQRDNVGAMLGGLSWSPGGHGVICMGGAKDWMHKLVDSEFRLAHCVEEMAEKMVTEGPVGVFTPDELARHPWAQQRLVNATTIVLVTNFMSQHSVWIHTLSDMNNWLGLQAEHHAAVTARLAAKGVHYRKIFMTSTYIHGFKTGGLTPGRSRFFNDLAKDILGRAGWEILDNYNVSRPRPDGTVDGVHPRGGVSIAVTDIMMNAILNPTCSSSQP